MRTVAMIVARLGSTRLPQKAARPILGKPMIERMIERVRQAKEINEVVIATTTLSSDDPLIELASSIGCGHFRGSPENVSERMAQAAQAVGCDTVVELLADNPLVHSDLIDDVLKLYRQGGYDYTASATKEYGHLPSLQRFPIGIRVQAYSAKAAKRWKDFPEYLSTPLGTTAFMFMNEDQFKCGYLEAKDKWSGLNYPDYHFAVNYLKNFELIDKIFAELHPRDKNFTLQEVVAWMAKNPKCVELMG